MNLAFGGNAGLHVGQVLSLDMSYHFLYLPKMTIGDKEVFFRSIIFFVCVLEIKPVSYPKKFPNVFYFMDMNVNDKCSFLTTV